MVELVGDLGGRGWTGIFKPEVVASRYSIIVI